MKKYIKHLIANWKVSLHAINDAAEHFLHGLIPAISWEHQHQHKVRPEVVAYLIIQGEKIPDYRCNCGFGVSEDYKYCPYCGAELEWEFREGEKRMRI